MTNPDRVTREEFEAEKKRTRILADSVIKLAEELGRMAQANRVLSEALLTKLEKE